MPSRMVIWWIIDRRFPSPWAGNSVRPASTDAVGGLISCPVQEYLTSASGGSEANCRFCNSEINPSRIGWISSDTGGLDSRLRYLEALPVGLRSIAACSVDSPRERNRFVRLSRMPPWTETLMFRMIRAPHPAFRRTPWRNTSAAAGCRAEARALDRRQSRAKAHLRCNLHQIRLNVAHCRRLKGVGEHNDRPTRQFRARIERLMVDRIWHARAQRQCLARLHAHRIRIAC